MVLKSLHILNYKNLEQLDLEFSSQINCFSGNNGQGKTNLLDTIYYLAFCKSFFNTSDSQNVKNGEPFFVIQGFFERNGEPEEIYCGFKEQKKKIKRNGKDYKRFSEHFGFIPLVIISPNDNSLISDGSEERRKYLDGVISLLDKSYLNYLLRYNHALEQRNSLLKAFVSSNSYDAESLSVWDQQLLFYGEELHFKRKEFVEKLIPVFQSIYKRISLENEIVTLEYKSQLSEEKFEDLLLQHRERDRYLQHTSHGIHKDDLILKLDIFPIKKAGSQGQQKTFLTALKLAQFQFFHQVHGFPPILLLDDIFDKFDKNRVFEIVKLVAEHRFGQIFITDTDSQRLRQLLQNLDVECSFFEVEKGAIQKV